MSGATTVGGAQAALEAKTPARALTMREIIEAQPKVTIRIPLEIGADPDTVNDVIPVQVNGIHMQIRRGERVEVPVSIYLALRQAAQYDI